MGLLKPEVMKEFTDLEFPDLDESDYAALEKRYGAAHVEAIKAGQKAVDPTDMAIQGRLRDDQYRPEGSEGYVDDYGIVDPKVDLKPEAKIPLSRVSVDIPEPHEILQSFAMRSSESTKKAADDYLHRAMTRALRKVKDSKGADLIDLTHEELDDLERNPDSLEKYLAKDDSAKSAGEPAESDFITRAQAEQLDEAINQEMDNALKSLEGSRGEELSPSMLDIIEDGPAGFARLHSAEAPELGKVPGMAGLYKLNKENSEADDEGIYTDIQRLTGMSLKELKSLFNKVLVTRFVHNQTRLGKIRSLSVLAICGNGNGRLGIAMAKSTEAEVATQTAKLLAIRNMKPIRRYENRTVFGNVKAKVSGTIVELSARPPGKPPPLSLSPLPSPPSLWRPEVLSISVKQYADSIRLRQALVFASPTGSSRCVAPPASTISRPTCPAQRTR